jgi:hypothetical protein
MRLEGILGAVTAALLLFLVLSFAASIVIALAIAIPVLLLGALFGKPTVVRVVRPGGRIIDHEP